MEILFANIVHPVTMASVIGASAAACLSGDGDVGWEGRMSTSFASQTLDALLTVAYGLPCWAVSSYIPRPAAGAHRAHWVNAHTHWGTEILDARLCILGLQEMTSTCLVPNA